MLLPALVPCSGQAPAPAPGPEDQPDIRAGLLHFADNITNFQAEAQAAAGWSDRGGSVCTWRYINCTNGSLSLDLSSTSLSGTLQPSWGQDLAAFASLDLSNTGLQGTLPDAWAQAMTRLQSLNLSGNYITSSFPASWAAANAFPYLETLKLSGNYLSGSLPELDGTAMPGLQTLELSSNGGKSQGSNSASGSTGFQGTIPASWSTTHASLVSLALDNNDLTSTLPSEWGFDGALPNLTYLNVSSNNLRGPLPSWGSESGLQQLRHFIFSNNALSATLPASWANMYIYNVDGSNAKLTGSLPTSWNHTGVRWLYLYNNQISGTLPAEWGQAGKWTGLWVLQLQSNRLTGTIPNWGYQTNGMQNLSSLRLDSNKLIGSFPNWGPNGTSLRYLQEVGVDNTICGTVPSNLKVLTPVGSNGNLVTTQTLTDCPKAQSAPAPQPASASPAVVQNGVTSPASGSSGSLSSGAIAGIVIGVVAAISVAILAAVVYRRRRRSQQQARQAEKQIETSLIPSSLSSASADKSGLSSGTRDSMQLSSPLAIFLNHSTSPSTSSSLRAELHSSRQPAHARGPSAGSLFSAAEAGLQLDWKVEPLRIKICQKPNGSYWLLGAGAYGQVYKAVMDGVNEVAIKLLKPETTNTPSAISNFIAEIEILRAARDDHVVAFRGAWANEDIMYYVCEYCQNGDLYTALFQRDDYLMEELSWYRRGKSIALQVAKGLFYLHANNIVHLDVKSPNILLTKQWQAKIADVGLARILLSQTHLSKMQHGTYNWQAPETLMGTNSSFSADIFSFGVVLLEIITGRKQVRGQYLYPRAPEQCPEAIAELAQQCMQPLAADRPTARDIISTIQTLHPDA
ncbi:hypothetical protein WJX73_000424 [Symbiochloris irregularis]|uniref:Protein kinase domain-containing protein n=1 Tax=Symbiochloris irregularis TaxID=706552 RepID=A0AAW1PUS5_9CHLO